MAPDGPSLTLRMPSDLSVLCIARSFVEAVCVHGGLDQTSTDAVVLASNEAISNVIRHAHRGCPGAEMEVTCRLLPDGIEVLIHDEGDPFDLTSVPQLDPAEIRVGGRGVYLMRALMDEVTCQPLDQGGNVLRMVKHGKRSNTHCDLEH